MSPDNNFVITADNITIRIWDIKTGNIVRVIHGYPAEHNNPLITSDGNQIVSWTSVHQIKIWDFATGILIRKVEFKENEYVVPIKLNNSF